MNRSILFAALLFMTFGCSREDPQTSTDDPEQSQWGDYEFCDDYYYGDYPDVKVPLVPCNDEFVIVFDTDNKGEVVDYIDREGFTVLLDGPMDVTYPDKDGFEIPEYMQNLTLLFIMGNGDIDAIPHIIFSDNIYVAGDPGTHLFTTNVFYVQYYDEGLGIDLFEEALRYADELKIIPKSISDFETNKWLGFICTDESAGKTVELANWFCEKAGFPGSNPSFMEENIWD